jgi:hypothetical protein
MSSIEEVTIKVRRYRDANNEKTCALSFPDSQICVFLRLTHFGQTEVCLLSKYRFLERRKRDAPTDLYGTLIPGKDCPIWEG